jgi:uncharacterized protein involved in outer membrane biogenesis
MAKIFKWLLALLLLVVIVIGVVLFFVANNLNYIVKTAIEDVGTHTLETPVLVGSVHISLIESHGTIERFVISNPEPFDSPYFLKIDEIVVDLFPSTLVDNLITIDEASIDGAEVIVEQQGGTTNLQTLLQTLQRNAASTTAETDDTAAPTMLVRIKEMTFTNTTATLDTEQFGSQTLVIPNMVFSNLGGNNGVPADQITDELMEQLIDKINAAAQRELQAMAREQIEKQVKKQVGDTVDDAVEKVKSLFD